MAEGLTLDVENSKLFKSAKAIHIGKLTMREDKSLGDWSDGGTPGPIPNPEVKTVSADGTWGATPWESRSSPRDFSCTQSASVLDHRLQRICSASAAP